MLDWDFFTIKKALKLSFNTYENHKEEGGSIKIHWEAVTKRLETPEATMKNSGFGEKDVSSPCPRYTIKQGFGQSNAHAATKASLLPWQPMSSRVSGEAHQSKFSIRTGFSVAVASLPIWFDSVLMLAD